MIQGYSFNAIKFKNIGDYKIIRISNIQDNKIDTKNSVYVSESEYRNNDLKKYKINKEDILIAMSGASVGKIGINCSDEDNLFLNQRVGKFKPNYKILNNKYLYFWLSKISQNLVKDIQNQSIANLNSGMILGCKIPIPPIETQNKIVKILDKFSELTEGTKSSLPKEIKLRKQQYEYYRNKLLDFPKE